MGIAFKSCAVACATAASVMLGVVGTASPAQAGAAQFRLRNVTTGTCLKYNGDGKAVTQVKCAKVRSQYWGRAGQYIVTMADAIPGLTCLTSGNGHEKSVTVKDCNDADITHNGWGVTSTNPHDKTVVANPVCGYLKVISGKVICGKRVAGNRDLWEIY
ncbi:ricin-type beta-trefoil lectin domain protein [Streptomyces sp. NPDC001606]